MINELKSYEPHSEEESPVDHLCTSIEENKESWIVPHGDKPLELKLEDAKEDDTWNGLNKEIDQ